MGLTYKRDANEAEHCVFLGAGEGNTYAFERHDSLSLAVDAEGQMAIFVTKTLRVCSQLVVLTYCI